MRHLAQTIILLAAISLTGCAKDAFTREALPKIDNPNPTAIREAFASQRPDTFVAENAFVIHAPFRDDFAFLGVVQVDRAAGTFEFVGLSQTGVQYFHVSGDRGGNHVRDAIGPLMKQKRILLSFAEDVRRMYLDATPSENAKASVRSKVVRFSEKSSEGKVIRNFGGEPTVLLEKRVKGLLRTKWRARYFDYTSTGGKLYPRGILVMNGKYFYCITLKNRNWEAGDPSMTTD